MSWVKSSLSATNGECVEVCELADGGVAMRNSNDPHGIVLRYTKAEWHAFLHGVKAGEFDAFGAE